MLSKLLNTELRMCGAWAFRNGQPSLPCLLRMAQHRSFISIFSQSTRRNPRLSLRSFAQEGKSVAEPTAKETPKAEPKPEAKKVYDESKMDEEEEPVDYTALRRPPSLIGRIGTILFFGSILAYAIAYYMYKKGMPDYGNPALKWAYGIAAKTDAFYKATWNIFTKPLNRKMLPDMPKGAIVPKTFVLNLTGTLIHSEYKLGTGYELSKRPGLDVFLQRLSRMGEVVVFANEDLMFLNDVYEHLDPRRSIFTALFGRESMAATKKGLVKDLSYLNRDLSNVVVIDWDPKKLSNQPDNIIAVSKYEGETSDRELYRLLPFLEHLASPSVIDVRKEIEKYKEAGGYGKYLDELVYSKTQLEKQRKSGIGGIFDALGKTPK